MFLEFLETFRKSSEASPWLNAINLASFAASTLPHAILMAVSVAVMIGVKVAVEVQSRSRYVSICLGFIGQSTNRHLILIGHYHALTMHASTRSHAVPYQTWKRTFTNGNARTNNFLDKINNEFFRPRGLYCLIMIWGPENPNQSSPVNLSSTIQSSLLANESRMGKVRSRFKSSSDKTYGEMVFPEVAPLIFPKLDNLAEQTSEVARRKRDKLKKKGDFVDEYYDKRARARYVSLSLAVQIRKLFFWLSKAGKHPNSLLAQGTDVKFSSRYADSNYPASSGSILSLLTGGYINPPPGGPLALIAKANDALGRGRGRIQIAQSVGWEGSAHYIDRKAYVSGDNSPRGDNMGRVGMRGRGGMAFGDQRSSGLGRLGGLDVVQRVLTKVGTVVCSTLRWH